MAQPIDNRQKLINQDGTPTEYFIRVLRDRGLSGDSTEQQLIELANTVATLELDDLTDVDLVTTPPADGEALTYDSGLGLWIPGAGGGGGVPITFAHFREQQPNGTPGGGNVVGWQTRTLNTTVVNTIAGSSLATNQITLGPGTYNIRAVGPVYRSDRTKIRLRNITDGITALNGVDDYAAFGQAGYCVAQLEGFLTLTSTKTFELQQYIDAGDGTFGLGVDVTGSGEPDVYSEVIIQQVDGVTYAGGGSTPFAPWTVPTLADFSLFNIGSVVTTDSAAGIQFETPAGNPFTPRGVMQVAPTAPYDVYAKMDTSLIAGENNWRMGIGIKNNTTGQIQTFGFQGDGNALKYTSIEYWNSIGSFAGTVPGYRYSVEAPWLRLNNDGTNLTLYVGDGYKWIQALTVTIAAFIGAVDEIGFLTQATNPSIITLNSFSTVAPAIGGGGPAA